MSGSVEALRHAWRGDDAYESPNPYGEPKSRGMGVNSRGVAEQRSTGFNMTGDPFFMRPAPRLPPPSPRSSQAHSRHANNHGHNHGGSHINTGRYDAPASPRLVSPRAMARSEIAREARSEVRESAVLAAEEAIREEALDPNPNPNPNWRRYERRPCHDILKRSSPLAMSRGLDWWICS